MELAPRALPAEAQALLDTTRGEADLLYWADLSPVAALDWEIAYLGGDVTAPLLLAVGLVRLNARFAIDGVAGVGPAVAGR